MDQPQPVKKRKDRLNPLLSVVPDAPPIDDRTPRIGDRVLVGVAPKEHAVALVTDVVGGGDEALLRLVVFRSGHAPWNTSLPFSARVVVDVDVGSFVPPNRWCRRD